jgi:Cu/Zn superoxide dismutase
MMRNVQENTIAIAAARKEWRILDVDTGAAAARGRIGNEAINTTRATVNAVETIHQAMTREAEMPNGAVIGNEKDTMPGEIVAIAKTGQTVKEVQTEAMPAAIVTVHVIEGGTTNEKHITVTIGIGSTDGNPNTRRGRHTTDRTNTSHTLPLHYSLVVVLLHV